MRRAASGAFGVARGQGLDLAVAVGAAVVLTLSVAACSSSGGSAAPSPPTRPISVRVGSEPTARPCFTSVANTGRSGGLVTVDRSPTSVQATWIPGMNATSCATQTTTGSGTDARRLAAAVRAAPKSPRGLISCPMDDGAAVRLTFRYGTGTPSEQVLVKLDGCATIGAPGFSPRSSSAALRAALAPHAPPAWSRYVASPSTST